MKLKHKHVLIISDIEGSSGCWNYEMSSFMTPSWPSACLGMSKDVAAIVDALLEAGIESVMVKDFHRTAYNLIPEIIDERARIVHGYQPGPVPGIGDPESATALIMIGMHAPSGSGGFLAHTLTSRIAKLEVNGELMSEAQLFSASVAPYNIVPVFFSGCPVACHYALQALEGITCFPISKTGDPSHFKADAWREEMAQEAVRSLTLEGHKVYSPEGPFQATVEMRDGAEIAQKTAQRWGFHCEASSIYLSCQTIKELYHNLMRLCYLTPVMEKILPLGMPLFNLRGKLGLWWVKNRLSGSLKP